jgi:hypothetical protein
MRWAIACLALGCATAVSQTGYRTGSHPGVTGAEVRLTGIHGAVRDIPLSVGLLFVDGALFDEFADEDGRIFVPLAPGVHWIRVCFSDLEQLTHVTVLEDRTTELDAQFEFPPGFGIIVDDFEREPYIDLLTTNRGWTFEVDELHNVPWGTPWGLR